MNDLLLEAFKKENVEAIIESGLSKTISLSTLRTFKDPLCRADIIKCIVEGDYKIAPPRVCQIPKDNGKIREIYVNTERDRLVLALANRAYINLYGDKLSSACKAYLPGCSTSSAVRDLVKHKWDRGYKIDLSKYFDSVPRNVLYDCLREIDTGSPLDAIVAEYYKDDVVIIKGEQVPRYKSLAQGCAVSTFLANWVLRDVDNLMLTIYPYYARYSDDIVVFGYSLDPLVSALNNLGLTVNPNKLEELTPDQEFTFLGYGVRGRDILISKSHFVEIKKCIKHACKTVRRKDLASLIQCVQKLLLYKQEPFYSWLYRQSCVTDYGRFVELDEYCKDCIRATLTGSHNYTHNVRRYPNEMFIENGWLPIPHLINLAKMSRPLFYEEVKNI